jgi:hypothetical protein
MTVSPGLAVIRHAPGNYLAAVRPRRWDDQAVVVDRLAFGQRELPPVRIRAGCGGAQPQVQVQLVSRWPLHSRSRSGSHWPDSNCLDSEGWP